MSSIPPSDSGSGTRVDSPGQHPLEAIFAPKNVAVIGATDRPGSVGRALVWNLISSPFGGCIFPINPRRSNVLGIKAYAQLREVPEPVDLAIVVTPAPTVPEVIGACAEAHVKGAIIISAGFREHGPAGVELEQRVLAEARRGKMRIIGPNCLGAMRPTTGLNATFAATIARPGTIGFISQSGALGTAVLDWSLREHVGFSAFVSLGSMLDVGWGDLIDYLGDDPLTKSILIYMESIGDARSFLSAAREVALTKPILVLKAGRTEGAAKAVVSHTGSLTGSADVLDAAFRRCGVLRLESIDELFSMAEALAKQPRPKGPRLCVLTNAGGPGVLATDALIAAGGELAQLTKETVDSLDRQLPPHWSRGNPIDILGDADPKRYAQALEIAARDPNSDGLLVILTPQAMTEPTQTAEQLKPFARVPGKPILASWMGGAGVEAGLSILNAADIPTYAYPDDAARAFHAMWRFTEILRGLYETPTLPGESERASLDRAAATEMVQAARKAGRTVLTEVESKQLLAAYGILTVETRVAASETDAVAIAEQIGYPVVVKLHSETVTHKTEVGGVRVRLLSATDVGNAYRAIERSVRARLGDGHFLGVTVQPMITVEGYEILVGSSIDPQFGPVLLFGSGGILAELYRDRSLALPPVNTTLARRMMERTRIFSAFQGIRGRKPVDVAALEQLLVRFSQLVVELPWVKEIDINPLLVSDERPIALDARVVVHGTEVREEELPRLAIRPYPTQYVAPWALKDGTTVTIRPIRPEDEPLFVKFHQSLSERSVYLRYFHVSKLSQRIAHERLTRVCFIDYDRQMALVAELKDPGPGGREIIGVGRLSKVHHTDEAEFAVLVSDRYQGQGLGTELLRRLIEVGRDEKLHLIWAQMLLENRDMQRVCEKLGAKIVARDGSVLRAEIALGCPQDAGTPMTETQAASSTTGTR